MDNTFRSAPSFADDSDLHEVRQPLVAAIPHSRYAYSAAASAHHSRGKHRTARSYRAPVFTRRLPSRSILILLFIAAAVACIAWFGLGLNSWVLPLSHAATQIDTGAQSTPRSEWTQGSVPLLFQTDPEWAEVNYDGATLEKSGCGPTCMSMVYIALTGKTDYDPAAMYRYAHEAGYMSSEGILWSFFTEGTQKLGLQGEELAFNEWSIREQLAAGKPVICSMGPGDFTTSGHIIVLVGIDQNHKLIVHDPNSAERSAKHWDFETIMSQCRNLWTYTSA